jgi:hypothetical protein
MANSNIKVVYVHLQRLAPRGHKSQASQKGKGTPFRDTRLMLCLKLFKALPLLFCT